MGATSAILDFSAIEEPNAIPLVGSAKPLRVGNKGGIVGRPITSTQAKQIRARARRRRIDDRGGFTDADIQHMYQHHKPIEEWDMEELARGQQRDKNGHFTGAKPKFLDRTVHEQALKRFEMLVRGDMQLHTISALTVIDNILKDDRTDEKGKPTTPAATKLEASKFLIEHLIGKPKQRQEVDISVRLQSILGAAMVNPSLGGDGGYELAQGSIPVKSWEEDEDVDARGDE